MFLQQPRKKARRQHKDVVGEDAGMIQLPQQSPALTSTPIPHSLPHSVLTATPQNFGYAATATATTMPPRDNLADLSLLQDEQDGYSSTDDDNLEVSLLAHKANCSLVDSLSYMENHCGSDGDDHILLHDQHQHRSMMIMMTMHENRDDDHVDQPDNNDGVQATATTPRVPALSLPYVGMVGRRDSRDEQTDDESSSDCSSVDDSSPNCHHQLPNAKQPENHDTAVSPPANDTEVAPAIVIPCSSPRKRSSNHPNNCHKSVSFASILVHYHAVGLGDSPSVTKGPPIALTWERLGSEYYATVDFYEAMRAPSASRGKSKMRLRASQREKVLLRKGVSPQEIRFSVSMVEFLKEQSLKNEYDADDDNYNDDGGNNGDHHNDSEDDILQGESRALVVRSSYSACCVSSSSLDDAGGEVDSLSWFDWVCR